ncbi:MAG: response regulator [Rickettsiales bacterium]|nr:response regulator [Rickettsiales bacterium]
MFNNITTYSETDSIHCKAASDDKTAENPVSKTILIVDDNVECGQGAGLLLESLSCKIVTVLSTEDAMKYLEDYSRDVYLILLDVNFPKMSGLEFLHKIKQVSHLKDIPVILQSGCSDAEIRQGMGLGSVAYIQKPYTKEELYKAINTTDLFTKYHFKTIK